MTKTAFGDSITVGVGASPAGNSWIGLYTPVNNAVSNTGAGDVSNRIRTLVTSFEPDAQYMLMVGTNDHRVYKNDPDKQGYWKAFLRNCVAWLSLEDKKIARTSPDITFTGTWGNATGNAINKYTTQLGAKAEVTVEGTSVYVGYIIQNSPAADSTAEVYIDGNLVGEIKCYGAMTTSAGASYADACARFDNLSDGPHDIEIVTTTSGKNFYLNYVAGNNNPSASYPEIKLSNVIRMSDARYTSFGTSDANVDAFNAIITDLKGEFDTDGFDVTVIDNHSSIDPDTDLADGVHPNNSGHAKIHQNFEAA